MSIRYYIDHARQMVFVMGSGRLSEADVFGYQREVWNRPDVTGYDELADMSEVEEFMLPDPAGPGFMQLAMESAARDDPTRASKFAIVAPEKLAFGLGRMYATYREQEPGSTKEVQVFTSLAAALDYLGVEAPDYTRFHPLATESDDAGNGD